MIERSNISAFMNVLLQSKFLQFKLLSSDDFLKFLVNCGIEITLDELEYYDKKEIIRPAMRLFRQKTDQRGQKYATILNDNFFFKHYYDQGLVEFAKEGDFKSWENYRDGTEKAVELYYHKYQFVPVRQLILGIRTTLYPQY
jgi:hypothetical protein